MRCAEVDPGNFEIITYLPSGPSVLTKADPHVHISREALANIRAGLLHCPPGAMQIIDHDGIEMLHLRDDGGREAHYRLLGWLDGDDVMEAKWPD